MAKKLVIEKDQIYSGYPNFPFVQLPFSEVTEIYSPSLRDSLHYKPGVSSTIKSAFENPFSWFYEQNVLERIVYNSRSSRREFVHFSFYDAETIAITYGFPQPDSAFTALLKYQKLTFSGDQEAQTDRERQLVQKHAVKMQGEIPEYPELMMLGCSLFNVEKQIYLDTQIRIVSAPDGYISILPEALRSIFSKYDLHKRVPAYVTQKEKIENALRYSREHLQAPSK